jgi:dynein heavy chain, axonemal
MISDTQLEQSGNEETIMEDVNNLLNQGEIPNLWNTEDREEIAKAMRHEAEEMKVYENIIGTLFLSKVRTNLHLIVTMSPIGDAFRRRLRMFPSLISNCQIDWFEAWPQEALVQIAIKFIEKFKDMSDPDIQLRLSRLAVSLHT